MFRLALVNTVSVRIRTAFFIRESAIMRICAFYILDQTEWT